MDRIIVIGGKGSAVVIAEQIWDRQTKIGDVKFEGFAFDDESFGDEINGFPIVCKTYEAYEKYKNDEEVKFLYALYRPDLIKERIRLRDSYNIPRERFANFIHQSAYVARSAKMGVGNIVLANSVINAGVEMGDHNTVHYNVLIGHDNKLGNSNFVTGHCAVGSNNIIGDGVFIGLNSTVNNYISIGDFAFIAMGSNVIKSVGENDMVMGNPARIVERKIKAL